MQLAQRRGQSTEPQGMMKGDGRMLEQPAEQMPPTGQWTADSELSTGFGAALNNWDRVTAAAMSGAAMRPETDRFVSRDADMRTRTVVTSRTASVSHAWNYVIRR